MTRKEISENEPVDARFLNKSYQEAMALTQDVAHYFEEQYAQPHNHRAEAGDEIFYASESLRISSCLMHVMSWFLVQKGVAAGEITKEEAGTPKMRLGAKKICLVDVDPTKGNLPTALMHFLEKSQNLYRQVARMDRMVYGEIEDMDANPVHQLMDRLQKNDRLD
ncbi:DUF1465 family protein [Paremcibacter congregatus]|uniref:DUF1465 family protein n=1 Tax=Paremcibacter congregatus TaxID=2043170 RepID=UPI0030EC081E|tara:strand:- start:5026 stop:5520 length:495 start_codon:yes stop_codon:yes gene_type:complete